MRLFIHFPLCEFLQVRLSLFPRIPLLRACADVLPLHIGRYADAVTVGLFQYVLGDLRLCAGKVVFCAFHGNHLFTLFEVCVDFFQVDLSCPSLPPKPCHRLSSGGRARFSRPRICSCTPAFWPSVLRGFRYRAMSDFVASKSSLFCAIVAFRLSTSSLAASRFVMLQSLASISFSYSRRNPAKFSLRNSISSSFSVILLFAFSSSSRYFDVTARNSLPQHQRVTSHTTSATPIPRQWRWLLEADLLCIVMCPYYTLSVFVISSAPIGGSSKCP